MKSFAKKISLLGIVLIVPFLTGCAAGSATAAYSLKSREADYLSAAGEQRITDRVKGEVMREIYQSNAPIAECR